MMTTPSSQLDELSFEENIKVLNTWKEDIRYEQLSKLNLFSRIFLAEKIGNESKSIQISHSVRRSFDESSFCFLDLILIQQKKKKHKN